ncbi:ATP-binding protein [Streptomyces antimycoticus]|uniref:ATP-binding protein n=1 Tax=Streptomyces antimycoticus TaxID=68175 RepID=UPI003822B630
MIEISHVQYGDLKPGGLDSRLPPSVNIEMMIMNATTLCRTHRTFSLPPSTADVPGVRRALVDTLVEWGLPEDGELLYALGLIASELVTNAVTHAGAHTPSIVVTLAIGEEGTLELGVSDNCRVFPRQLATSPEATHGRGTAIVDALLAEFGGSLTSERHPHGKTLWAQLPGALS